MNIKPGRNTIIVNSKTHKFCLAAKDEQWKDDWPEHYPVFTKGSEWDVFAVNLWDHQTVTGIPYTYDLCRDGGMFTLWVDVADHNDEAIRAAKKQLRRELDVVSLTVFRMKGV